LVSGVVSRHWLQALYPTAAALAVWFLCFDVVGRWLVERVYVDASFPIGGGIITGSAAHPLAYYVDQWNRVSWYALPLVLFWTFAAFGSRRQWLLLFFLLTIAAEVRVLGLAHRSIWDDEGITLLQTSGNNLPRWPADPGPAARAQELFRGATSCGSLVAALRDTDVHPPLYFCALAYWKGWFGYSLESARSLSVAASVLSILAFFLLLRIGGMPSPIVPAAVYALSPSATFWGSEARPYAFAELFVVGTALCSYVAARLPVDRASARGAALAAGACAGLALQTNHLTMFPVGALLLWLIAATWPQRRWLGVIAALVAGGIGLVGAAALYGQLGARPSQAAGFLGVRTEIEFLFGLLLRVLFYPYFPRSGAIWPYALLGAGLLVGSLSLLLVQWRRENQSLWAVLLILAFAPSVGLVFLNVVFGRHLHDIQYVHYAASGAAALVTYPVVRLTATRRAAGIGALAAIAGVQALGINWGFAEGPLGSAPSRDQAASIASSASVGQLVLIDAGLGRSNPASLVYELDPQATVLVYGAHDGIDELWQKVRRYSDLWIRFSTDHPPPAIRDQLLDRLEQSGCYTEVSYATRLLRLRQESECAPTRRWPSRPRMQHDLGVFE
jgi:hypothetical protein